MGSWEQMMGLRPGPWESKGLLRGRRDKNACAKELGMKELGLEANSFDPSTQE